MRNQVDNPDKMEHQSITLPIYLYLKRELDREELYLDGIRARYERAKQCLSIPPDSVWYRLAAFFISLGCAFVINERSTYSRCLRDLIKKLISGDYVPIYNHFTEMADGLYDRESPGFQYVYDMRCRIETLVPDWVKEPFFVGPGAFDTM